MTKKQRVAAIIPILEKEYPNPNVDGLIYEKPYQIVFALRLAAQCTDERVNKVTKELFKTYDTLQKFAEADLKDMEKAVYSCGFYRMKAADIIGAAQMLILNYGGVLPDTMEELLKLPGIGRKSANLILGDIYNKPGVVICDTHCIRITNLLGLTTSKSPVICEKELRKLLPPDKSNHFCHRMVLHGRAVCIARRPQCEVCMISEYCNFFQKGQKETPAITKK